MSLSCIRASAQLREIDSDAILGKRTSPYGVQAVVRKADVPASLPLGAVNLEELFLFMIRGENE